MAKNIEKPKKWKFVIFVLIALALVSFLFASCVSLFVGDSIDILQGNVALIPIKGIIMTEEGNSMFDGITSSSNIIEFIEKADSNPAIVAIIFEIDSPGGTPVASDEIAQAIKNVNKTTVAWIRELGASGAYWIASSADHVVAHRMSITGSIGVIGSYLEFSGLLDRYNVSYQRLVGGEYKDIGTPFRELSLEEELLLQKRIDMIHDYFIEEIAKNRKLPENKVREVATGMFYLGVEAKDLGLVDALGGKDEAIKFIEEKHEVTVEIAEYKTEKTLLDVLSQLFNENSFLIGKGIGSELTDTKAAILT